MKVSLPRIWSRRQREADPPPEIYTYDSLPLKLRVQICQIWEEVFGSYYGSEWAAGIYKHIVTRIRKEKGVFHLARQAGDNESEELKLWFLKDNEIAPLLDALEISLDLIDGFVRQNHYHFKRDPDDAISEINARMLEAAVGYQYKDGYLLRVDNLLIHKEVVLPALQLLTDTNFAGANAEFLEAHKQFRAGDYERCLTECCKAFESVLKVIGQIRGWPINPNDTSAKLLSRI